MKLQITGMKKKSLSDFNQFINAVICSKQEKGRNIGVGTEVIIVDGEVDNKNNDNDIFIEGNRNSELIKTGKKLSIVN